MKITLPKIHRSKAAVRTPAGQPATKNRQPQIRIRAHRADRGQNPR